MTNEFQANNQTNIQANQEELQKASEAKTIVNGKVVPVKEAQAAEQLAEQQMQGKTGIQQHQDNNTQAVQAGQIGQAGQMASGRSISQAEAASVSVKQGNVQSGQAHLEEQMNQAKEQVQQLEQQMKQQAQQNQQVQQNQQAQQQGLTEQQQVQQQLQKQAQQAQAKAAAKTTKKVD